MVTRSHAKFFEVVLGVDFFRITSESEEDNVASYGFTREGYSCCMCDVVKAWALFFHKYCFGGSDIWFRTVFHDGSYIYV